MRNTLRPVWWFVLPYIDVVFEGVPARPYIVCGDRVTWKSELNISLGVLPEYYSGSFLLLRLVLLLYKE
jgi:hypothetical protein